MVLYFQKGGVMADGTTERKEIGVFELEKLRKCQALPSCLRSIAFPTFLQSFWHDDVRGMQFEAGRPILWMGVPKPHDWQTANPKPKNLNHCMAS